MATVASGLGMATVHDDGTVLEVWFPQASLDADTAQQVRDAAGDGVAHPDGNPFDGDLGTAFDRLRRAADHEAPLPDISYRPVSCVLDDLDAPPQDSIDVYLRLRLLSQRLVQPHGLNVEGTFGLLANVAWTHRGPTPAETVDDLRMWLAARGDRLSIRSVDKFPRMTDHLVPSGVRIGNADRVRLGAHLAEGTTIMHEGFVNFNAGTLGAAMIEGRISAGVVIGDGSDLGGSASVMGTLSGGGSEVIRIGEGCLVGANAGVGISLGDGCVVEAGLYVTAGTKVTTQEGDVIPARTLSGRSGLLFRRNSMTGRVEVLEREGEWGSLNAQLHDNN